MSEETEFKKTVYMLKVDGAEKPLLIVFQETQEDTLQSFYDKLESGKFQTLKTIKDNSIDDTVDVRINTARIIAYSESL